MCKMKLSSSTSLFHINKPFNKKYSIKESMILLKEAGFEYLDFNFYDNGLEGELLDTDDWKTKVKEIKLEADKLGIAFNQTHAFCYRTKESTDMSINREWFDERIKRSIIASSILGAKWTVVHPNSYLEDTYDLEKNKSYNLKYWKPFVELAENHNIGIAFENMFPSTQHNRYCSDVDELIDLVDSFDSEFVGVCWDTGHASLSNQSQEESIIKVGSRLKALHINDNNAIPKKDEHLIPYFGVINWEEILRALKEINYSNDFAFEMKQASQVLPLEMEELSAKCVYKLGETMITILEDLL